IVGEARLGIDGTAGLRGDEVEASDVGHIHFDRGSKTLRAESVGVDVDDDVGGALAGDVVLVGDHHLALRPDGDVAKASGLRPGCVLRGDEVPDLAEAGHGGAARLDRLRAAEDLQVTQTLPAPVVTVGWSTGAPHLLASGLPCVLVCSTVLSKPNVAPPSVLRASCTSCALLSR